MTVLTVGAQGRHAAGGEHRREMKPVQLERAGNQHVVEAPQRGLRLQRAHIGDRHTVGQEGPLTHQPSAVELVVQRVHGQARHAEAVRVREQQNGSASIAYRGQA